MLCDFRQCIRSTSRVQYFSSLIYTCTSILLYKSIFLQKGEIMLKQNRRRFACPKRAKDFALKKLLYISSIPTFLKTHLNIPWIYRITKKPPDFRRPDFPANYPYIFSIVSQFRQTGDLIFFIKMPVLEAPFCSGDAYCGGSPPAFLRLHEYKSALS